MVFLKVETQLQLSPNLWRIFSKNGKIEIIRWELSSISRRLSIALTGLSFIENCNKVFGSDGLALTLIKKVTLMIDDKVQITEIRSVQGNTLQVPRYFNPTNLKAKHQGSILDSLFPDLHKRPPIISPCECLFCLMSASNFLIFSDDIKVFEIIASPTNYDNLQRSLTNPLTSASGAGKICHGTQNSVYYCDLLQTRPK